MKTATCCCQRSRIAVTGEPVINGVCHCANCKRRTGSAIGWSAYFADSQITAESGPLKIYELTGNNPSRRWFCDTCGTTLFWRSASAPGFTGIAAGCFEQDALPEPTVTINNHGRCDWVGLPDHWETSIQLPGNAG